MTERPGCTDIKLEWLQDPDTGAKVIQLNETTLASTASDATFEIRDGIPIFLNAALAAGEEREHQFWESSEGMRAEESFATFSDDGYAELVRSLSIPTAGLGLEYACGSASFSQRVSSSATIVGLDISLALLMKSKRILPIQGNGSALPFRDSLFDFVICSAALHHIPDLHLAITEIQRTLKIGGSVHIIEPNVHHPQRKLVANARSPLRALFPGTEFSPEETLIPEQKLREALREHFEINTLTYMTPEYRNPSLVGRLQHLISQFACTQTLQKFLSSYIVIKATKVR